MVILIWGYGYIDSGLSVAAQVTPEDGTIVRVAADEDVPLVLNAQQQQQQGEWVEDPLPSDIVQAYPNHYIYYMLHIIHVVLHIPIIVHQVAQPLTRAADQCKPFRHSRRLCNAQGRVFCEQQRQTRATRGCGGADEGGAGAARTPPNTLLLCNTCCCCMPLV